jgi:ADP-heptose:LPS heptosyltransferase
MDKILIIRLSSLGDVLLATPIVRALAKRYPYARVDFLTKAQYAPLLDQNPFLRKVLRLEKGGMCELLRLRSTLRKEYDLVVDLHKNLRSFVLTPLLIGPRVIRAPKHTILRQLLVRFKWNLMSDKPSIPLRNLEALRPFGVKDDGQGLDFFGDAGSIARAKDVLTEHRLTAKEAIGLAPGAKWFTKRWPLKNFIRILELLPDRRFILLGEDRETALGEEIARALPGRAVNLMGRTDLQTAGEILRRCKALITNDTGLMHLGCAVKIPVVALFGSTRREFGFFPFRARSRVLEKELACRPCTTVGKDICKLGTLECLEGVAAQEVVDALQEMIA